MFSTGNISTHDIGLMIQRLTTDAMNAEVIAHYGNVVEIELEDSLPYIVCVVPMAANKNDIQTFCCIDLDPNDIYSIKCKQGNTPPFILLGYDLINDVYVMWHPAIVKSNLENCNKRYSYYANIAELRKIKEGEKSDILNYKGLDLCYIHRKRLVDFQAIIKSFNYDSTDIKTAIVSQFQLLGPKESFERFVAAVEKDDLRGYTQYIRGTVKISNNFYPTYIRRLFREKLLGTEGKFSHLFSDCPDLMLYHKPIDELLRLLETEPAFCIKSRGKAISATGAALRLYLEYLNNKAYLKEQSEGYAAPGRFTCNFNKRDRVKVLMPDGTTIYTRRSIDTIAEVIKMAGIDRVWNLKLTGYVSKNGMPLICKAQDLDEYPKSKNYYTPLSEDENGVTWYLFKYGMADVRRRTIKKISEKLNLGLRVYLIRSIGTRSTEQEGFYQFKDSEIELE